MQPGRSSEIPVDLAAIVEANAVWDFATTRLGLFDHRRVDGHISPHISSVPTRRRSNPYMSAIATDHDVVMVSINRQPLGDVANSDAIPVFSLEATRIRCIADTVSHVPRHIHIPGGTLDRILADPAAYLWSIPAGAVVLKLPKKPCHAPFRPWGMQGEEV
jgi:hypothetical protein